MVVCFFFHFSFGSDELSNGAIKRDLHFGYWQLFFNVFSSFFLENCCLFFFFGGHQVLMRFEHKNHVASTRLTIFHKFTFIRKVSWIPLNVWVHMMCDGCFFVFIFAGAFYHFHRILNYIIISRLIKFKFVSLFRRKFVDVVFSGAQCSHLVLRVHYKIKSLCIEICLCVELHMHMIFLRSEAKCNRCILV